MNALCVWHIQVLLCMCPLCIVYEVCVCFFLCRYKRFLRSKDLSVVSAEDLDCVLGRRKRRRQGGKTEVEEQQVCEGKAKGWRDGGRREGGGVEVLV